MDHKLKKMTKTEVMDVQIKARRRPRFKAGSELSGKVNRVAITIDQNSNEDADAESLDIGLKWETEAELANGNQE